MERLLHEGLGRSWSKKLILLAGLLATRPDELRADFQRVYGLNIDDMGESYTVHHAAVLAAMLPSDSLVFRASNPALEWSETMYMLRNIEFLLRVLAWQNTKDGQKGRKKPKPIETPEERAKLREKALNTDWQYIAEQLNIEL